jgi:multidrug efflux pump subunit AcrA (membrane-fusion protein)
VALCLALAFLTHAESPGKLVCVARLEAVAGEVEVFARLTGTLIAVPVKEGDWVKAGDLLAEVDAPVEKANLALAEAKLARIKAGNGREEIAAAQAERDAIAQELAFAEKEHKRAAELKATGMNLSVRARRIDVPLVHDAPLVRARLECRRHRH